MEKCIYHFNYKIGKLYRFNGKEEKIFLFNSKMTVCNLNNGDIICFLTEPYSSGIETKSYFCKILHSNGSIGEMFWDKKTYNVFTLVSK